MCLSQAERRAFTDSLSSESFKSPITDDRPAAGERIDSLADHFCSMLARTLADVVPMRIDHQILLRSSFF